MAKRRYLEDELGGYSVGVTHIVHSRFSNVGGSDVEREVDGFARVYHCEYNMNRVLCLSGGASKLLWFSLMNVCFGDNYVVINVGRFMKKAGVSSMTSYRSYVKELIDANIFGRTKIVDVFYFDHNLFFKGSRVHNLDNALVIPNN